MSNLGLPGKGASPSEKYSGEFEDDLFHGKGVHINSEGQVYEGLFRNGKKIEEEKA